MQARRQLCRLLAESNKLQGTPINQNAMSVVTILGVSQSSKEGGQNVL